MPTPQGVRDEIFRKINMTTELPDNKKYRKRLNMTLNKLIKIKALELETIFTSQEIGLIKIYFPVYFPSYNEQGGYESQYKKYTKMAKRIHEKCSLLIQAWSVK